MFSFFFKKWDRVWSSSGYFQTYNAAKDDVKSTDLPIFTSQVLEVCVITLSSKIIFNFIDVFLRWFECPHRLIYLNTWATYGRIVWEGLEGVPFLGKVFHWR